MPSGKQILLAILQEYSQSLQNDDDLDIASDKIRAVLCLHCSTAGETMAKIEAIGWLSQSDEQGALRTVRDAELLWTYSHADRGNKENP